MGRLPAAQATEFELPAITAVPLLEFDLPDGTTHKMSFRTPIPSASRGYYHPRLSSLDPLVVRLDLVNFQLHTPEIHGTFEDAPEAGDTVGWFSRIAANYRGGLFDLPTRIRCASTVASTSWLLGLTGRMIAMPRQGRRRAFTVRPLDADLQGPLELPKVRPDDWPNAPSASQRLPIGLGYGSVSDRGTSGTMKGIALCTYVDSSGPPYRYVVPCGGWAYQGEDIFVGGVRTTANIAFNWITRNGRRYTVIDSDTNRGTSTITCNFKGPETIGDRLGTWISHPVDILKHLLANWIFARSETGVWTTDLSGLPIDEASFTAVKASLANRAGGCPYVVGRWITEERQALSYINEICESIGVAPYWTPEGKLALYYHNPHESTKQYSPDAMLRRGLNLIDIDYPGEGSHNVIRTLRIEWAGDGTVAGATSAQDLLAPGTASDSLSMTCGALTDQ